MEDGGGPPYYLFPDIIHLKAVCDAQLRAKTAWDIFAPVIRFMFGHVSSTRNICDVSALCCTIINSFELVLFFFCWSVPEAPFCNSVMGEEVRSK